MRGALRSEGSAAEPEKLQGPRSSGAPRPLRVGGLNHFDVYAPPDQIDPIDPNVLNARIVAGLEPISLGGKLGRLHRGTGTTAPVLSDLRAGHAGDARRERRRVARAGCAVRDGRLVSRSSACTAHHLGCQVPLKVIRRPQVGSILAVQAVLDHGAKAALQQRRHFPAEFDSK